jgi:hypothetical protein
MWTYTKRRKGMKARIVLIAMVAALLTLGFSCINDNFLISVNLKGISGTYAINPGDGNFNKCITKNSSDYLDANFSYEDTVRIYDIQVSTIGTYTGNVNGTATVNGATILSFNGPFTYFNTPRSLLNDPKITRNPAGISALIIAIRNQQPVTLCGVGAATPGPFPAGDSVKIEVFGQIDATP